jgi:hypothetical protein
VSALHAVRSHQTPLMCAKPPPVNDKRPAMCDPTDPRLCGFHRAEDLQREPDPPGSWGWFWIGFAIVAGALVVVWWL